MQVAAPFDVDHLQKQYPATYQESMNTVLVQEALRYNALLEVVAASLKECAKAVKGLVVMSPSLEAVSNSMYDNQVCLTTAASPYLSACTVVRMHDAQLEPLQTPEEAKQVPRVWCAVEALCNPTNRKHPLLAFGYQVVKHAWLGPPPEAHLPYT